MMNNSNNPELKTWFDDALKQGHTIDELIPHLKEHGYTDEMIDPVVSQLKAELDQTTVVEEVQSPQSENSIESDSVESTPIEQEENQESNKNINVVEKVEEDIDVIQEENQENNENINVIEKVEDDLDNIEAEDQEENKEDDEQDSGELTLEEIEAELDAQSKEIDQKNTKSLMKPLISIVILIAVLIGGYVAYPKVLDIINNFTQSTPKAAPPTLPGNSFDNSIQNNTDFVEEQTQTQTSLNEPKIEETTESGQKLRKFKKELYFQ